MDEIKVSSNSPEGMTDKDEKCYEGRYKDLNSTKGREHYSEKGSEDGRLNTCGKTLTAYEAQRYLDGNPDL